MTPPEIQVGMAYAGAGNAALKKAEEAGDERLKSALAEAQKAVAGHLEARGLRMPQTRERRKQADVAA